MTQLVWDLRQAWRGIRRMRWLAAVVVISLGVGIGVNAAVFSWIQAIVLQPIPGVAHSGRFQLVEPRSETGAYPGASWLEYKDLSDRLPSVDALVAFRMVPVDVGGPDDARRAYGMLVSGNYFSALGLKPAIGRLIGPAEASRPGEQPIAVISYDFWQSQLAGTPSIVGTTLRANDRPVTVVGVAPRGFQGTIIGLTFDIWVPATMAPVLFEGSRELETRSVRGYSILGGLRSGAAQGRLQRDLDAAMRDLAREHPSTNRTMAGEAMPIWQSPRGPQRFLVTALATLQAVLLLVLLTVCGNTANLVLARASSRRREVAVRLALGAGRWRVLSLLLTESLLLALAGAALGAVVAVWATEALRNVPMIATVPIRFQTSVDLGTLVFAVLLGLSCGVVFGLAPAIQLSRVDPQASLRAGASAPGRSRVHDVLMAAEVALALVVLIAAGLFLKSFMETQTTDPGFRREGVLLSAYDLRGRNRSADGPAGREFARRALERLRALPSVESAAIAAAVPLDIHGLGERAFLVEGRARTDGLLDRATANTVTDGYFQTMGIPFVAGRDFADLGDASTPPQVIVNQEFVRAYVPTGDPIRRRIEIDGAPFTIAGVVRNSLSNAFGEPSTAVLYLSYRDRPGIQGEIHVRTRPGAEGLVAPDVRRVVSALEAGLPVYNVRSLTEHVDRNLIFRRIPARMFVVLGPLLLALAAVGISAVVAHAVTARRVEIGMRLALGATAGRVVGAFVGDTMRVILVGLAIGWSAAFVVAREAGGVAMIDAGIFSAVPALLLLVALAACWWPARRAAHVDPMLALRAE
jgi:predicted permease